MLFKYRRNIIIKYTYCHIAGARVQSRSALQDSRATPERRHGRVPRHQHIADAKALQFQPAVEAFSAGATASRTGGESARHRAAVDHRTRGDDTKDDDHSDARGRGAPWQRRVSGTEAPTRHVLGERATSAGRRPGVFRIARTAGEHSDVQDEPGESRGPVR